ncbi:phosphotransferase [Shewanella waksmanii]|uniref:phosphotransferase n=1 Tax=Shewanella waksmanii TaxID=213783 RepID=UPI0004AE18E1|nr:phosphotransferase [Shewanella waksmanii]
MSHSEVQGIAVNVSTVAAYLKQITHTMGVRFSQHTQVFRLSEGLSNLNYLIKDGEQAFVLRLNHKGSDGFVSREHELNCWQLAAQAKLAPKILFVSEDRQCYLSEFIVTDKPWSQQMTASQSHADATQHTLCPDAEQRLADLLLGLQSLPLPANHMGLTGQWQHYLQQLALANDALKASSPSSDTLGEQQRWCRRWHRLNEYEQVVRQAISLSDSYLIRPQFCHRDLTPHNLLHADGRLFCIDFEYACASHPLFDLAVILQTHNLSSMQQQRLCDIYFAQQSNLKPNAANAMTSISSLYWFYSAAWALLMAAQSLAAENKPVTQALTPYQANDYFTWFDDYLEKAIDISPSQQK